MIEDLYWELRLEVPPDDADQGCSVSEKYRTPSRNDNALRPAYVHLRPLLLQDLDEPVPGELKLDFVEVFLGLLQVSAALHTGRP